MAFISYSFIYCNLLFLKWGRLSFCPAVNHLSASQNYLSGALPRVALAGTVAYWGAIALVRCLQSDGCGWGFGLGAIVGLGGTWGSDSIWGVEQNNQLWTVLKYGYIEQSYYLKLTLCRVYCFTFLFGCKCARRDPQTQEFTVRSLLLSIRWMEGEFTGVYKRPDQWQDIKFIRASLKYWTKYFHLCAPPKPTEIPDNCTPSRTRCLTRGYSSCPYGHHGTPFLERTPQGYPDWHLHPPSIHI